MEKQQSNIPEVKESISKKVYDALSSKLKKLFSGKKSSISINLQEEKYSNKSNYNHDSNLSGTTLPDDTDESEELVAHEKEKISKYLLKVLKRKVKDNIPIDSYYHGEIENLSSQMFADLLIDLEPKLSIITDSVFFKTMNQFGRYRFIESLTSGNNLENVIDYLQQDPSKLEVIFKYLMDGSSTELPVYQDLLSEMKKQGIDEDLLDKYFSYVSECMYFTLNKQDNKELGYYQKESVFTISLLSSETSPFIAYAEKIVLNNDIYQVRSRFEAALEAVGKKGIRLFGIADDEKKQILISLLRLPRNFYYKYDNVLNTIFNDTQKHNATLVEFLDQLVNKNKDFLDIADLFEPVANEFSLVTVIDLVNLFKSGWSLLDIQELIEFLKNHFEDTANSISLSGSEKVPMSWDEIINLLGLETTKHQLQILKEQTSTHTIMFLEWIISLKSMQTFTKARDENSLQNLNLSTLDFRSIGKFFPNWLTTLKDERTSIESTAGFSDFLTSITDVIKQYEESGLVNTETETWRSREILRRDGEVFEDQQVSVTIKNTVKGICLCFEFKLRKPVVESTLNKSFKSKLKVNKNILDHDEDHLVFIPTDRKAYSPHTVFEVLAHEIQEGVYAYNYTDKSPQAYSGYSRIDVRLDEDKTPEDITKLIFLAAEALGIEKSLNQTTPEDSQLLAQRRVQWQENNKSVEADINSLEWREVFDRYSTYVYTNPEKLREYYQAGLRYFFSSMKSARGVVGAIQMGATSSNERRTQGIIRGGVSLSSDIEKGGADYAFLRIASDSTPEDFYFQSANVSGDFILLYKPDLALRTDWFGYTADHYGNTRDDVFDTRKSPKGLIDSLSDNYSYSNEACFKKGVSKDTIVGVLINEEHLYDELMSMLHQKRITHVNGVPIERAIQTKLRYKFNNSAALTLMEEVRAYHQDPQSYPRGEREVKKETKPYIDDVW